MAKRNMLAYTTAAFDCETDPFREGRVPAPFCCCFAAADGTELTTWGPDCVPDMMAKIAALPDKYLIYVHNGGRYDFHFLWDWIEDPAVIIGGRLIEFCQGVTWRGAHRVWRDSFSILPMALADFGAKVEIDYGILEADKREAHRETIEHRCMTDARELVKACEAFRLRFEPESGRRHLPLTIGQLALREFGDRHKWTRATRSSDEFMRPWYFGGRNECYRGGVLAGPWEAWDSNSHYGAAMAQSYHPVSDDWIEYDRPPPVPGPWFARVTASNTLALPWRDPDADGKVTFEVSQGMFWACGHELSPAIADGRVVVHKWHEIWKSVGARKFDRFVNDWMVEKVEAEARGDRLGRQIAKIVIATVSGKMGQDPRHYREWELMRDPHLDTRLEAEGWRAESLIRSQPDDWLELWSRPTKIMAHAFNNVGIAASILSASRALLLAALPLADDPVYCDTDGIICRSFNGPKHPTDLGKYKLEATADFIAIAGRKTYCMYNKVGRKIVPVKWASKSERMTPEEIIHMARGGLVEKVNAAPRFSLHGAPIFTRATYRRTV